MKREKMMKWVLTAVMTVVCMIWLIPFFMAALNSFKPNAEMVTNVLALPKKWSLENYIVTWKKMDFLHLYRNNIIYTVFGTLGIVFFGSLAGHRLCRCTKWYSSFLFYLFIIPIMLPFQVIMITFSKLAGSLHLTGSIIGVILCQWGFGIPMATFLYKGYSSTIPKEIEECANLDGAGPFRTFFYIIFPLLKPITATVIITNALAIWNDFMIVLLLLGAKKEYMNIPLAIYNSFGRNFADWSRALPSRMYAVVPAVVAFIFLQKYIVQGITAGSVKG